MKGIVYDNTFNHEVETCDFVRCTNCGKFQLVDLGEDGCCHCGHDGTFLPVFREEPEISYHDAPDILGAKGFAVIAQSEDGTIRQKGQFPVTLTVESESAGGYQLTFPDWEGAVIFAARNTLFREAPATEYEPLKCLDSSSASMFSYHYVTRITIEEYVAGKKMNENNISTTDQLVEALWCTLEDIPIDPETEELETAWFIFEAGTDKYEGIWRWFDGHYSKGVARLMGLD